MQWKRFALFLPLSIGLSVAAPKPGPKAAPKPAATAKKTMTPAEARRAAWDTSSIHKQYIEGDFEEAIDQLETGLNYVSPLSHEDSVFIFKHLGVMYTSKYETREKGKKFMMRLLEVEPTARIMDMYASDMIYMIFKNIQDEYDMAQLRWKRAQNLKDPGKQPHSDTAETEPSKPAKTRSYKWVPWTLAAVGLAGGGVVAYSLLSEKETRKKENVIP
jgi:hypothetical protein